MEAMVPIWLGLSHNDQGISGNVWAWAGVRSHLLSVALEHMCPMQLNRVLDATARTCSSPAQATGGFVLRLYGYKLDLDNTSERIMPSLNPCSVGVANPVQSNRLDHCYHVSSSCHLRA